MTEDATFPNAQELKEVKDWEPIMELSKEEFVGDLIESEFWWNGRAEAKVEIVQEKVRKKKWRHAPLAGEKCEAEGVFLCLLLRDSEGERNFIKKYKFYCLKCSFCICF